MTMPTPNRQSMSSAALPVAFGQLGAGTERLLIGIVMVALVRAGEAMAGESASLLGEKAELAPASRPRPAQLATLAHAPPALFAADSGSGADDAPRELSEARPRAALVPEPAPALDATPFSPKDFSLGALTAREPEPRDFRPRARSLLDPEKPVTAEDSLVSDSETWQRLASEYRVHGRVRVLTLWDAGWSSVSLQAGKHGDPYVQWTGHLFGSAEAHRGLLDRLLPTPAASEHSPGRGIVHALTQSKPLASIASKLSSTVP